MPLRDRGPVHEWGSAKRSRIGGRPGWSKRPRRRRGCELLWIRPAGEVPPDHIRLYYTLTELLRLASVVAAHLERLGSTPNEHC
jgi:hypothetical protein